MFCDHRQVAHAAGDFLLQRIASAAHDELGIKKNKRGQNSRHSNINNNANNNNNNNNNVNNSNNVDDNNDNDNHNDNNNTNNNDNRNDNQIGMSGVRFGL